MDTRSFRLLDLYTDYLISSLGQTTATGLATLVPDLSHDQITRFLSRHALEEKDLWRIVKTHVRRVQSEEGVLILDDTIEEKPYTDESELICWHWDHTVRRNVKGINLLSALYYSQEVSLPVSFHLIHKTERVTDRKTGKEKWQSPVSKNELAQQMVQSALVKQIPFRYVLADSWFSSVETMTFLKQKAKKDFIIPLKANRNVFLADPAAKVGQSTKLDAVLFDSDGLCTLYLEKLSFPVLVLRQVFINEDGSQAIAYLATSDRSLSADRLREIYQKRWKIEEFHKSLKSNASLAKSPTKTVRTQSNHFFASIVAFIKLEACRIARGKGKAANHFALKSKIYIAALNAGFKVWQEMMNDCPNAAITP